MRRGSAPGRRCRWSRSGRRPRRGSRRERRSGGGPRRDPDRPRGRTGSGPGGPRSGSSVRPASPTARRLGLTSSNRTVTTASGGSAIRGRYVTVPVTVVMAASAAWKVSSGAPPEPESTSRPPSRSARRTAPRASRTKGSWSIKGGGHALFVAASGPSVSASVLEGVGPGEPVAAGLARHAPVVERDRDVVRPAGRGRGERHEAPRRALEVGRWGAHGTSGDAAGQEGEGQEEAHGLTWDVGGGLQRPERPGRYRRRLNSG